MAGCHALPVSQRKQPILGQLQRDGQIVAKLVSEELGLSEDTIRRDLRALARDGFLQRVHGGGALPASPAIADFAGREQVASQARIAIGRTAAMEKPGQVVILDGGTTTREMARHLPPELRATVVTHSTLKLY